MSNVEVKKKVIFDPAEGYQKIDTSGGEGEDIISEWERHYPLGAAAAHITGYLGEVNEDETLKVDAACPEKGFYH